MCCGTSHSSSPVGSRSISSMSNNERRRKRTTTLILTVVSMLVCTFISFTTDLLLSKHGIVLLSTIENDASAKYGQFTAIATASPPTPQETIVTPQELLSSPYYHDKITISPMESFAIIINTYKRPDMLKDALNHYVNTCGVESNISQIFVVWSELDVIPPNLKDILPGYDRPNEKSTKKKKEQNLRSSKSTHAHNKQGSQSLPQVEFIRVPKNSLNSRFLPIENLKTDSVFMVDDDLRVECGALKSGFEAWTLHSDSLVGYYPRLASPARDTKNHAHEATDKGKNKDKGKKKHDKKEIVPRIYHTWPMVYTSFKFNIILTKASFFHKKYLDMYFDKTENPTQVLDYVDAHKNCEDIAMSFLIGRKTRDMAEKQLLHHDNMRKGSSSSISNSKDDKHHYPYCTHCPVYVSGYVKDEGLFNGISTGGGGLSIKGHMDKRSQCLDEMTKIYKDNGWDYPLFDVTLDGQSWQHHPFWYQYAPNNFFEWFSFGNTFL